MMAGKDTKAALLLALTPKGGAGPVEEGGEKESDTDAEDLTNAIKDRDGAALKDIIRRIAMSCMSEEDAEGEG